jgi:hypothetical protein
VIRLQWNDDTYGTACMVLILAWVAWHHELPAAVAAAALLVIDSIVSFPNTSGAASAAHEE